MTGPEDIYSGSIAIEGSRITAIGHVPPSHVFDRIIEGNSMVAIPGLVNAHTHLSMTYFRNFRDSVLDLHDWLKGIWKLEERLVPEDISYASTLGIAEMIRGGTTCFADMYFFPEQTCAAALQAKIKANIGITLFGDLKDSQDRVAQHLGPVAAFSEQSHGLLCYDIAPHAIYTCSDETYHYAVALAQEHHCRLHTHASETKREVADCQKLHLMSPIAYLASLGAITSNSYLAHCVHPVEGDLAILSDAQATVVHNPSSNCKLASGIAPIFRMKELGIPLALGSDGASSNNMLDLFAEMRLAAFISSVSTEKPTALSPYDILSMATVQGARALGRESECGTLEVGKDADIVLIDLNNVRHTPLNNIWSALVYATLSSDVDTVLCQGEVLMEHGVLKTIDLKNTIEQTNTRWRDILSR